MDSSLRTNVAYDYSAPTVSQLRIAKLIAKGKTTAEIAAQLKLSPKTVEVHRNKMLRRMGCANSAHLVGLLFERGLLTEKKEHMEITLRQTSKIVTLNNLPARLWEGQTASGIPIHAFITRIGVTKEADLSEFERELESVTPMTPEMEAIPLRMIL